MENHATHKGAIKLAWAIFWRWMMISLTISLPLMVLKSSDLSTTLNLVIGFVEIPLYFVTFHLTIYYLLKFGFKNHLLAVKNKVQEVDPL